MSATIKDVAREAGVSVATVSRVLNGNCNVSEDSASRVNDAIKKLHYSPNLKSLLSYFARNFICYYAAFIL